MLKQIAIDALVIIAWGRGELADDRGVQLLALGGWQSALHLGGRVHERPVETQLVLI